MLRDRHGYAHTYNHDQKKFLWARLSRSIFFFLAQVTKHRVFDFSSIFMEAYSKKKYFVGQVLVDRDIPALVIEYEVQETFFDRTDRPVRAETKKGHKTYIPFSYNPQISNNKQDQAEESSGAH